MKHLLITGVSSGIGYGAAKAFASHGYHVFGNLRNAIDAQRLQTEIGENFTPLLFDVTKPEEIQQAAEQVTASIGKQGLAGLINNAGVATLAPLQFQSLAEIRWQFEVNVLGLVAVTQAFLPLLGARHEATHPPGRMINISSMGGKVALPFLAAYSGSKHAVEAISHSLRRELKPLGIDVIIIGPGAVKSAIWEKPSVQMGGRYAQSIYATEFAKFQKQFAGWSEAGYTPEHFGQMVRQVFETKRPKTRYALVPNKFTTWSIPSRLPDHWLDWFLARLG